MVSKGTEAGPVDERGDLHMAGCVGAASQTERRLQVQGPALRLPGCVTLVTSVDL